MSIKNAVIPGAGLGTRFLPATKTVPEEMFPIVDKPTLRYMMEEIVAADISEVVLVAGRQERHRGLLRHSYEVETRWIRPGEGSS